MYEIKTFQESFLPRQVEIGNAVLSTWLAAQQTPLDRLQQIYSQDDFDPETKFYALKDGEVVGFIPAKLTGEDVANLEFPIVLNDHEGATEPLMDYALEALKNKGVQLSLIHI